MARLLTVLATTGAVLLLIVGSLGLLPRSTDAGGIIPGGNLVCDVSAALGPSSIAKETWYFNSSDSFDNPFAGSLLTTTKLIAPFTLFNNGTGAQGFGLVRVLGDGTALIQTNERPTVAFPATRDISTTLSGPGLVFTGNVLDTITFPSGSNTFTGLATLTINNCLKPLDP